MLQDVPNGNLAAEVSPFDVSAHALLRLRKCLCHVSTVYERSYCRLFGYTKSTLRPTSGENAQYDFPGRALIFRVRSVSYYADETGQRKSVEKFIAELDEKHIYGRQIKCVCQLA